MGRFATDEELGEQIQYRYHLNPEDIQKPFLHQHEELMKQLSDEISKKNGEEITYKQNEPYAKYPKTSSGNISVRAKSYLMKRYEKLEDTYNGFKALAWLPNVEYYLNLAASGKKNLDNFNQWDKYSRIVGVTWSGSVDPDMNFFRAEMYANESGRRLAGVLKQLIDKKIRINIITHSLGARVALSAMNVLGDFGEDYADKIDNLIMWEAAVADNAITNMDNYEAKKAFNPLAMEIFPYAYKVPKHITVLYSQEDGVLDGDIAFNDDEYLGLLGGAYPKKYWSIGGSKWAFKDYYQGTEIEQYRETIHVGRFNTTSYTLKGIQRLPPMSLAQYRKSIRELLEQEAKQVNEHEGIAELKYLKPWSHFRRFPIGGEVLEHIIEVLTNNVVSNWSGKGSKVRAALGHQGERQTVNGEFTTRFGLVKMSEQNKKLLMDKFIKELSEEMGTLSYFGQLETRDDEDFYYFISHSAMREWEWKDIDIQQVFPLIYKYSYKEWIMDRKIQDNSKFGRY